MSGTTSGVLFRNSGSDTHMTVFRGKSLNFEVIWGGSAPIDITGFTASLQARDAAGALMMELSTANGRVVNGGADGKLTFSAPPSVTQAVNAPGTYELELTAPSGDVYRVISGKVSIEDEVAQ
jgi:hypothetical protein